jgi:hypothetical protein
VSALPPYNPPPSDRRLWLVNSETPAAELEGLLDSAGGADRVERIAGGDPAELHRMLEAGDGDLVMVAPEETLQSVVLALIGGQPGMARLRFLPGTVSQVQFLSGRPVVRHLNLGVEL